ncbi:hypothetical protein B4U80_07923 [Leptotrombidium deliense]|uniref:PH domain-containing protein n=1 Tax=Leptotrombidium deliense TaxID=299467 RepID=A0A443S6T3_9ACAR|nr:hypothetical protein B4U80_07923 [Leptotrombidium deliense]
MTALSKQINNITTGQSYTLNSVLLVELTREVVNLLKFVNFNKTFIRKGCLLKLSKNGYQRRLFFLFSGVLIYCSRYSNNQFKIHGSLPLNRIMIVENETKSEISFGFTIFSGDIAIVLAANSQYEKERWIKDINSASSHYESGADVSSDLTIYEEPDCNESSDSNLITSNRSGSMTDVCWHRNLSIGFEEYFSASCYYFSGFLLRKFKSNTGWQKLWVVYTSYSLFFYKCSEVCISSESQHVICNTQDEFPLACLSLLGYHLFVEHKQNANAKKSQFKLQFKAHVYFFKTENEYFFERWVQILKAVTCNEDPRVCTHC